MKQEGKKGVGEGVSKCLFIWKIREFWKVTGVLNHHGVFMFGVQQSQKRSCDDATKRRLLPVDTVSRIARLKPDGTR